MKDKEIRKRLEAMTPIEDSHTPGPEVGNGWGEDAMPRERFATSIRRLEAELERAREPDKIVSLLDALDKADRIVERREKRLEAIRAIGTWDEEQWQDFLNAWVERMGTHPDEWHGMIRLGLASGLEVPPDLRGRICGD